MIEFYMLYMNRADMAVCDNFVLLRVSGIVPIVENFNAYFGGFD